MSVSDFTLLYENKNTQKQKAFGYSIHYSSYCYDVVYEKLIST